MTPWLVDGASGLISNIAFPFGGASADERRLTFGGAGGHSHRCPDESASILLQLEAISDRLQKGELDPAAIILDIDTEGRVLVRSRSDPAALDRVRRLTDEEVTTLRAPLGSPSRPGSLHASRAMPIDGSEL